MIALIFRDSKRSIKMILGIENRFSEPPEYRLYTPTQNRMIIDEKCMIQKSYDIDLTFLLDFCFENVPLDHHTEILCACNYTGL